MPLDASNTNSLTHDDLPGLPGPVLLEFGAAWCGYCRSFAPILSALLQEFPQVRHIKIEDGPGKPLGRSFRVKLWPTLVFLRDGQPLRQIARPSREAAREGLEAITAASGPRSSIVQRPDNPR